MKKARIIVLTIALIAGGIAAYLASGIGYRPPPIHPIMGSGSEVSAR
jgi:pilus assembly protein CpaB